MKPQAPETPPSPPPFDPDEVLAVVARATRQAILMHKRMGNPVCAWQDGHVIWLPPEEIVISEEE